MFALRREPRKCLCGESSGQYLADGLHVVYQGPAVILGIANGMLNGRLRNPPLEPYKKEYDIPLFYIGHWEGSHIFKRDSGEGDPNFPVQDIIQPKE
jgi:hypothetical protein